MLSSHVNQLLGNARGNGHPALVERHIALRHLKVVRQDFLRHGEAATDSKDLIHQPIISRPDSRRQAVNQSDCLSHNSGTYIVGKMTVKPLSQSQKADAARLMAAFKQWQEERRRVGEKSTQEEFAHLAEMGQSAFNQYANGTIPLNWPALLKFARLLGVDPGSISQEVVRAQRELVHRTLAELGGSAVVAMQAPGNQDSKLQKDAEKKRRDYPNRRGSRRASK